MEVLLYIHSSFYSKIDCGYSQKSLNDAKNPQYFTIYGYKLKHLSRAELRKSMFTPENPSFSLRNLGL